MTEKQKAEIKEIRGTLNNWVTGFPSRSPDSDELCQLIWKIDDLLREEREDKTLAQRISYEISATANDINQYLNSNVPIECYAKDIDCKLTQLQQIIKAKLIKQ